MVGTARSFKTTYIWLIALNVAAMLAVLTACGGSDDSSERPASATDTSIAAVIPAVKPEAGSSEAEILDVFNDMVHAINIEDWESYVENCDSELGRRSLRSAAEVESVFETIGQRIPVGSYNRRNATFRVFDDGTAITESDEYNDDQLITERLIDNWELAAGRWYAITLCSKQPVPTTGGITEPDASAAPRVALGEGVTVEPGSDEAEVFALWERMFTGLFSGDYEAYVAGCNPELPTKITVNQLEEAIEKERNNPVYGQEVFTDQAHVVLNEFRMFRDTMTVKWDWFEGEALIGANLGENHDKVAGRWYLNGGMCAG